MLILLGHSAHQFHFLRGTMSVMLDPRRGHLYIAATENCQALALSMAIEGSSRIQFSKKRL